MIDTLVVFQELIYAPKLLDCQQSVPAPSKVNGAVMVDVIGLQVEPLMVVAVIVGVRVGVKDGPAVGVLVRVDVGPAVGVRVRVLLATGVTPPL